MTDDFEVRQRALDGSTPDGQVTLDGDVVRDGESRDGNGGVRPVPPGVDNPGDAMAAAFAAVQATAEYYADHPPDEDTEADPDE